MRWRDLLAAIAAKSSAAGRPRSLPGPAHVRHVSLVERRLRMKLPATYRSFLLVYDGWPDLFEGVSLFGTRELGRPIADPATALLCARMGTPPPSPDRPSRFVPFAADARASSVFAWDSAAPRIDGELPVVLWLGEVGEHLSSFVATLELVLDLLPAVAPAPPGRHASTATPARRIDRPAGRQLIAS